MHGAYLAHIITSWVFVNEKDIATHVFVLFVFSTASIAFGQICGLVVEQLQGEEACRYFSE